MLIKPEVVVTEFDTDEVNNVIKELDYISSLYGPEQALLIRIDSPGGSLYGMASLYEFIQTLPNPIITYTSSLAMSAGAILLATAGDPGMRFASPNASIMIHQVQVELPRGDINIFNKSVINVKEENDKWMGILSKSMGLKNVDELKNMIWSNGSTEYHLSADKAKELGIVDEVCYLKTVQNISWEVLKETRNRRELMDEMVEQQKAMESQNKDLNIKLGKNKKRKK